MTFSQKNIYITGSLNGFVCQMKVIILNSIFMKNFSKVIVLENHLKNFENDFAIKDRKLRP